MLQADQLHRPARDLLGQMADFNQFPRRDKPCCLEDDLTGFPTSVLRALPVCLCQLRKGGGVFFSGSWFTLLCQQNFQMSPCWIVSPRETHWPWGSCANIAESTVWLRIHGVSLCLCASHSSALAQCCMQWHWVMPAIPMIDERLEALSTQAGIWSRRRMQHCPRERQKEGTRLFLLSSGGKQARKSGRKRGGCSTGGGDWHKLTF